MSSPEDVLGVTSIESYGDYSGAGYGRHTLKIQTMGFTFWFSYSTLVAFRYHGSTYVHENDWRSTTGRHLNWIDGGDKKSRLSDSEFQKKFAECFSGKVAISASKHGISIAPRPVNL